MDFRFNVNKLLPKRINKITHTLIPEGFVASERREYNDCQRYITRILDDMGEASAGAQGLNKTITSAIKLRDTDHVLYIMVDREGNNGLGSVVGLLKTGSKTLFMFDDNGLHYQLKPRCILDFYIHESRQRMGLGKELYQHMLNEEQLRPIKLAIDRPSEKLLAFLKKHYHLSSIIPQNNKFVVFQGFFDDEMDDSKMGRYSNPYSTEPRISSPRTQSNGQQQQQQQITNINNNNINRPPSVNGNTASRGFGRFAAARPPCSMATIIHDTIPFGQQEYTGSGNSTPRSARAETRSVCSDTESIKPDDSISQYQPENPEKSDEDAPLNDETGSVTTETSNPAVEDDKQPQEPTDEVDHVSVRSASPTTTIQDDEKPGHLDLKFYHSPLW